jgi:hypothetical protein
MPDQSLPFVPISTEEPADRLYGTASFDDMRLAKVFFKVRRQRSKVRLGQAIDLIQEC